VLVKLIGFRLGQSRRWIKLAVVLLVLWGLFIVYATMLPFDFSASGHEIKARLRRLWERPLKGGSWADVASNVLLFMPWGFLLAVWLAGRGRRYLATLSLALLSGALLSGSVELVQLFAPRRVASVIDLVTNTFGSSVGALVGWPWARWIWPIMSVRIRQLLVSRPMTGCALAAGAALVIAGVFQLHVNLAPAELSAALEAARPTALAPPLRGPALPPKLWSWAGELLVWVLAGGLFALAARESGRRGPGVIGWACGLAGGVSLAVLALRLAMPGHEVDITSIALALLGSALGAAPVARSAAGDASRWIDPALLIWGLAVVMAAWNPPRFTWPVPPLWRLERVVPFWSYFASRSLADLADVAGEVLAFMPLGALLAARSWRQSFAGAVLIGVALGAVLEIGQVFVPSRTADVTDVLSAAGGAGLGLALWRWGEWARKSSMGVAKYRVGHRTGGLKL